ncbi:Uncharacterised protein [uncultured archaeon]|nr:Uncharacterised protein [uncultured archaeon]
MVCPLCTIAVAAGVGVLESWGFDRIIIGLWFGALIVSSIAWMIDWTNRKNIHFLFKKILIILSFYAIFVVPLYFIKIGGQVLMGTGVGEVLGIDRLLFGIIIGTFIFIAGVLSNNYLKKINDGKVMIFWQKVIVPVVFLIISSVIAWLLIRILSG